MSDRQFLGIWIPAEIWESKSLTLQEKIFYVEIQSLDNEDGCFATNSYFAEFFGLKETRVSQVINSLVKKGMIKSEFTHEKGNIKSTKRVLHICVEPPLEKCKTPLHDHVRPPLEKCKHNNTINNKPNNKVIKHKYGEYKNVLLTDEQYSRLSEKLGNRDKWIKTLDEGIELKDYKYKNHYLAILKWAKKDGGCVKVSAESQKPRFSFTEGCNEE